MIPRRTPIFSWLLALVLLGSCAREASVGAADPAGVESSGSAAGGALTLAVDLETMRTIDRAVITLTLRTRPGYVGQIEPLDLESHGWGVVHMAETPAMLGDDGSTIVSRRVTVEPYLEGEYTIGAARALWRSLSDGSEGEVSTEPLSVRVISVLDAPGDLELEAAAGAAVPPAIVSRQSVLGVLGIWAAVAGLITIGVVGIALRSVRRRPEPTTLQRLLQLRGMLETGEPEGVQSALNGIVRAASPNLAANPELTAFIDRLDQKRYSGRAVERAEVGRDLREAIALFGGGR